MAKREILKLFPRSQHSPIMIYYGLQIPIVRSIPKPRWNYQKADWNKFSLYLDKNLRYVSPLPKSYDEFVKSIKNAAKSSIPRGYRRTYIPGWDENCEQLYDEYNNSEDPVKANELLDSLNIKRREKWHNLTSNVDFTHSSRKAWSFMKKLGVDSNVNKRATTQITPNNVASRLLEVSKATLDRKQKGKILNKLKNQKRKLSPDNFLSSDITHEELSKVLLEMKIGKAAGFDEIYPEMLKNCGPLARDWLRMFFSNIINTGTIPKLFKKSKVIAILKPVKDGSEAANYCSISLLIQVFGTFNCK